MMKTIKNSAAALLSNCRKYVPVAHYMALAQARHGFAGTFGGVLWWIAEPLLYSFIYYFIFAVVFESKTENFIVFLLIGLTVWRWFSKTIQAATASITRNIGLLRQVDIPKVIFPFQAVIVETYKFITALGLMWGILILRGDVAYSGLVYFPFVFVCAFALLLGGGLLAAAIAPFVPDLKKIVPLVFQGLLFMSGVFYGIERVPEQYRFYFHLNPFAVLIEAIRDTLLYGRMPRIDLLLGVMGLSIVLCMAGLYVHRRYNRVFARYLI